MLFLLALCPVARVQGLRDAPFIAHSTAPSKPEITAPPLPGALEVGWNGDPWGLEGGPRGGRIPGYSPLSLTTSLVPTPCPLIT